MYSQMTDFAVKVNSNKLTMEREIKTELVRKSIHMMVAFVPAFASVNKIGTIALLAAATILYSLSETYRLAGFSNNIISNLTQMASRTRDKGHFVLGPLTLVFGALVSIVVFEPTAAMFAIFALAFGDGISSLAGKVFGRIVIPGTGNKTLEGTFAGFAGVFFAVFAACENPVMSLILAGTAALIELIPLKDFDNMVIPLSVGLVASFLLM
jgi:dolichol kinase